MKEVETSRVMHGLSHISKAGKKYFNMIQTKIRSIIGILLNEKTIKSQSTSIVYFAQQVASIVST